MCAASEILPITLKPSIAFRSTTTFPSPQAFGSLLTLLCHFQQEIIWKAYSIRLLPKILISAILLENKRSNASSIYS